MRLWKALRRWGRLLNNLLSFVVGYEKRIKFWKDISVGIRLWMWLLVTLLVTRSWRRQKDPLVGFGGGGSEGDEGSG